VIMAAMKLPSPGTARSFEIGDCSGFLHESTLHWKA